MPDSSYYKNLYQQSDKEVGNYENNRKELQEVLTNLTDNFCNEQGAVNRELDGLMQDLKKAVRHNAAFSSSTNAFSSKKETTSGADVYLSAAAQELRDELSRVSQMKAKAVAERDAYNEQYKAKKQEE